MVKFAGFDTPKIRFMSISKNTFSFLQNIAKNNSRDWFADNKDQYEMAQANMIEFADEVLNQMNSFDQIETPAGKKAVKRIYRDVRFSKDKKPYKEHFGMVFSRATAARRGSYYIHIQPGSNFIGGGFWGPEKDDLLLIRKHLAQDAHYFRNVIDSKAFKANFGELKGEQLKTSPKGFDKEHPDLDLLRFKQFLITKEFTDEEVLSPDFPKVAAKTLHAMMPFFDIMTEMLTTNLNGESLLD